jgi:hypothetical protein
MRGGSESHVGGAFARRSSPTSVSSVSIPGASGSPWIAFGSRSVLSCSAAKPSGRPFAPWHAVQSAREGMLCLRPGATSTAPRTPSAASSASVCVSFHA